MLAGSAVSPGRVIEPPRRSLPDRLGRMGLNVVIVAWGLHVAAIALRGVATGRAPWGNMYEFVTLTCATAVAAGFVVLRAPRLRKMWVFVLIPMLILLFVAGTVLYADAAPVVPALQSYWLRIHVSVISLGSGVLMISGITSLLFLLRVRYPDGAVGLGLMGRFARRLPNPQTLDRLAYRTTISSRSRCSVQESSWVPSGPRQRGADFGAGTQRKLPRSSRSSCTPPTCMLAPLPAGAPPAPPGSTLQVLRQCSSTCSSSTWSSPDCTLTQG